MLPPDTYSNLLPWGVMVPLMQLSGCFPYKMSMTGGPPAFSLPLCLWAVFYQMFTFSTFSMTCMEIAKFHLTPQLGSKVFIYSGSFTLIVMSFLPFLVGVKSPELAAILHAMSRVQGATPPLKYRWYCRLKTLAFLFLFPSTTMFMTWYVTTNWNRQEYLDVMLVIYLGVGYNFHLLLPILLPAMVFDFLALRLLAATKDTVGVVSGFLAHDGSVESESDVRTAMLALCDLDAAIREVGSETIVVGVPRTLVTCIPLIPPLMHVDSLSYRWSFRRGRGLAVSSP